MTEQRELLCITGTHPDINPPIAGLLTAIQERGGTISLCRITRHGQSTVLSLSIDGHWGALSRLEAALPTLQTSLDMTLQAHRTRAEAAEREFRPYAAEVFAPMHNELLATVCRFFSDAGALIRDLSSQQYRSGVSGGDMLNVSVVLDLPMNASPHTLRDSFMDLCDELRADGVLDPIKS